MSEGMNIEEMPVLEKESSDEISESEAMERREHYIENLERAESINEIKQAIDDYAIVQGEEKAYINFAEDNYEGRDMAAGVARYNSIMEGLDNIERKEGKLSAKFLAENLNDYAIEMAVARVLNVEG
jgi:hypothetical protein